MSRLADSLSRLFGRVEIFARGADDDRRGAEEALALGHHLEARDHARSLLARVPGSPLGLALWADAAEGCWLDQEVVEALARLVEQVPWRHDVWLRLGQAGMRADWPHARAALERAAGAADDPATARRALLALADLDIHTGELARARRWLDRVPSHPSQPDPSLALRRAECAIAAGEIEAAAAFLERTAGLDTEARSLPSGASLAGRRRLVKARLAQQRPDEALGDDPLSLALGAMLLDAPGATQLLVELVAETRDAAVLQRVREAVSALGQADEPRWQAAFALAEGRRADARGALLAAAKTGDRSAAETLLVQATSWRDLDAIAELAAADGALVSTELTLLLEAAAHAAAGRLDAALAAAERAAQGTTREWAHELVEQLIGRWVAADGLPSRWDDILRELRRAANELERLDWVAPLEALAVERTRPLYVAVLGEFNAGKSTLLNALLGTDVAPTGVRPTTASLHWVAWAPDPFARVVVPGSSDRVVPHAELKKTLDQLRDEGKPVGRVFIYAPIERLKRIEILDTPGFNAPDTSHAEEARRGIEEAHVALWLLDATAPMKDSERRVIEQVGQAGVPIQVIVNKRDRVGEDEIAAVMAYVDEALAAASIRSLRPPLALSARLALQGRLGDEAALKASRWEEFEQLLAEHVVNRCDALRERALRRKARRIAGELEVAAAERAHADQVDREARRRRAERRGRYVAQLRSGRDRLAESLVAGLDEAGAALRADILPLAQLADERRGDAEIQAYVVERSVQRLAPALARILLERATEDAAAAGEEPPPLELRELEAPMRATLAGAAAAYRSGPQLGGEPLRATVEQCLVVVADFLEDNTAIPQAGAGEQPLILRLRALSRALGATADELSQRADPS